MGRSSKAGCGGIAVFMLLGLLGGLGWDAAALAATINVPGDYSNIQAAINAAVDGDTVLVDDGVYSKINFGSKSITVSSVNGEDYTVIDGNNTFVAVTFSTGSRSVLDGFTVTKGRAGTSTGGGIYCVSALPVIRNCTIKQNVAAGSYWCAGGITCTNSSPTIQNCAIRSNTTTTDGDEGIAGGILCRNSSSPVIDNCSIIGNSVYGWGWKVGGGIVCINSSSPVITSCDISHNSASPSGDGGGGVYCLQSSPSISDSVINSNSARYGGGIYCDTSSPVISKCYINGNAAAGRSYSSGGGIYAYSSSIRLNNTVVAGNTSTSYGAGLYIDNSTPQIKNCTISNNAAGGAYGGGIYGKAAASPKVVNSIIWSNTANGSPGEVYGYLDGYSFPSITYSDVRGGYSGAGNINAEPDFVGGGDYHLMATSPCINTGINTNVPTEDIDGDSRPYYPRADMGVDEFIGAPECQDDDGDNYTAQDGCPGLGVDCNDDDATVHPGAVEICDGKDNDCDGLIDEGNSVYYRDADGDGYANSKIYSIRSICSEPPTGYAANLGDCNDTNANIYPGATEVCDGLDNNCNGQIDEGVTKTYFLDNDRDTYGNSNITTQSCLDIPPDGYASRGGDCNDGDDEINPGLTEVCDWKDNNCNGDIDEGFPKDHTYYRDQDADTYGDSSIFTNTCLDTVPDGYASRGDDCKDTDADMYPGGNEVCDFKDNNCDGETDEGSIRDKKYYLDVDGDAYGDSNIYTFSCLDTAPDGYAAVGDDCNDSIGSIHPDAEEICANKVDENCDGSLKCNSLKPGRPMGLDVVMEDCVRFSWGAARNADYYELRLYYKQSVRGRYTLSKQENDLRITGYTPAPCLEEGIYRVLVRAVNRYVVAGKKGKLYTKYKRSAWRVKVFKK